MTPEQFAEIIESLNSIVVLLLFMLVVVGLVGIARGK